MDAEQRRQREVRDVLVRKAGLVVATMNGDVGGRIRALPEAAQEGLLIQTVVGYLLGSGLVEATAKVDEDDGWFPLSWQEAIPEHLWPDVDEAVQRYERMLAQLGTHVAQP